MLPMHKCVLYRMHDDHGELQDMGAQATGLHARTSTCFSCYLCSTSPTLHGVDNVNH